MKGVRRFAITALVLTAASSNAMAQNQEGPRDRCTWEGWLPPAAGRERIRRAAHLSRVDIAALQRAANSWNKVEREKAIERLGAAEDDTTPTLLAAALNDHDSQIVDAAARALGRIGDTSKVHDIERLTTSTNPHVRQGAVWALGQLQDHRALSALLKASTDTSKAVRDDATWALGLIGDPGASERLIELTRDAESHVRLSAACALWLSASGDTDRPLRALAAMRNDLQPLVRAVSEWVIAQLER